MLSNRCNFSEFERQRIAGGVRQVVRPTRLSRSLLKTPESSSPNSLVDVLYSRVTCVIVRDLEGFFV